MANGLGEQSPGQHGQRVAKPYRKAGRVSDLSVVTLNNRSVLSDVEWERGFIERFRSVIQGARILAPLQDLGAAATAKTAVDTYIRHGHDVDVISVPSSHGLQVGIAPIFPP